MRIYTEQQGHTDWCQFLPSIAFSYRIAVMGAIGAAPTTLMFARAVKLPTDILYGPKSEIEKDKKEFLLGQTAYIREAYDMALAVQHKADRAKKEYYHSKHLAVEYEVGDLVWLWRPTLQEGMSKKLTPKNYGPYEIVQKHSPVLYSLQVSENETEKAHIQRLIPCYFDPDSPPKRFESLGEIVRADMHPAPVLAAEPQARPLAPIAPPSSRQQVPQESILAKRFDSDSNEKQYLVKSSLDQNWEDASQLQLDPKWKQCIDDFERSARSSRRSRRAA